MYSKSLFYDCPDCGAGGIIPDEDGKCTNCGFPLKKEQEQTRDRYSVTKASVKKQQSKHGNITIKITGYIFSSLSVVPFISFSIRMYKLILEGVSNLNIEFNFTSLPVSGGLAFILFFLGRYILKTSKRKDIPELQKKFIVCKLINTIYGILLFALAIAWRFGNSPEGDPSHYPIFIAWTTSSLLFIAALVFTLEKKVSPSYLLMIIGGIITLPLGIIPLILGIGLKKHKSVRELPTAKSRNNYSPTTAKKGDITQNKSVQYESDNNKVNTEVCSHKDADEPSSVMHESSGSIFEAESDKDEVITHSQGASSETQKENMPYKDDFSSSSTHHDTKTDRPPTQFMDCPHCSANKVLPMPGHICPNCKKPLGEVDVVMRYVDCRNCKTKGILPMEGNICPNCKKPLA